MEQGSKSINDEPSKTEAQRTNVWPENPRPWYLTPHLLRLNLCIGIVLLSATTMGFDASMMNGLQGLDSWMGYFGNPSGTLLGLLNAVMFMGSVSQSQSIPLDTPN